MTNETKIKIAKIGIAHLAVFLVLGYFLVGR